MSYIQVGKAFRPIMVLAAMVAMSLLAGCGTMPQSLTAQQTNALTSTPVDIPTLTPLVLTPTLNAKDLFLAHVDETEVAMRTALAGTPTWTPGVPPPGPSATPRLGLFGTCGNKNTREPYIVTCWIGILNGDMAAVYTGREGLDGDPAQGILIVYTSNLTQKEVLLTPDKAGAISITAINGTLFTLITVDHQPVITYTFDLATRQWVPNPSGATPTLNAKDLFLAHEDQTEVAIRTALAGTPSWTPGAPPPYTGPTTTPSLGLQRGCANKNSLEPYMVSCWAGVYNGNIVSLKSGREGRAGDMTQGLVWVYNWDTQVSQFIKTPDKVGAVKITAINGMLFTLTTVDHQPVITYTFDLATRQWVNTLPTPSRSP